MNGKDPKKETESQGDWYGVRSDQSELFMLSCRIEDGCDDHLFSLSDQFKQLKSEIENSSPACCCSSCSQPSDNIKLFPNAWDEIVQQGVRCLVHWLGLQLGPVQPAPHNTESLRVRGDGVAFLIPGVQVQEDLAACAVAGSEPEITMDY